MFKNMVFIFGKYIYRRIFDWKNLIFDIFFIFNVNYDFILVVFYF